MSREQYRQEKIVKIGGKKITVYELTTVDIIFFYKDVETFTALSGFMEGDFVGADKVLERCIDIPFDEIKDLGGSGFMELVREIREVNADFFVMLREETLKMTPTVETQAKTETKTP